MLVDGLIAKVHTTLKKKRSWHINDACREIFSSKFGVIENYLTLVTFYLSSHI